MNGFHDFDDFRVVAWMSEGLMIRMNTAVQSAKKAARNVAGALAITMTVVSAATGGILSIQPSQEILTPVVHLSTQAIDPVDVDLRAMTMEIDAQLATLLDFSDEGIDPATLRLAESAVSFAAARKISGESRTAPQLRSV